MLPTKGGTLYNYEFSNGALKTCVRLRQASEAMEKVLEKDLDERGSTPEQLDVLAVLDATQTPPKLGQLSKYLFRKDHSTCAQLNRMWRSGIVKKARSKEDQRVVGYAPTSKGKKRLGQDKKVVMDRTREIVASALSQQELAQLDELLRKVRDRALERLGQRAEELPESFDVARYEGMAS